VGDLVDGDASNDEATGGSVIYGCSATVPDEMQWARDSRREFQKIDSAKSSVDLWITQCCVQSIGSGMSSSNSVSDPWCPRRALCPIETEHDLAGGIPTSKDLGPVSGGCVLHENRAERSSWRPKGRDGSAHLLWPTGKGSIDLKSVSDDRCSRLGKASFGRAENEENDNCRYQNLASTKIEFQRALVHLMSSFLLPYTPS